MSWTRIWETLTFHTPMVASAICFELTYVNCIIFGGCHGVALIPDVWLQSLQY